MPPLVPLPSAPDQITSLTTNNTAKALTLELAEQLGVDGVVPDAKGSRVNEATETDDEPSDHRPPHPVQMASQLFEEIFGPIDRLRHQPRGEATGDADRRCSEQDHSSEWRMRWNGEDRLGRDQAGAGHHHAEAVGGRCCDRDENHRSGFELECQQLYSEQRGRDRGSKHGAHSRGGSCDQEALALGGSEVEELTHDRPNGTTRQDDWSLGAEGPPRPDADGAGDRLQDRKAWLDLAAIDEDPFHRLRDAVPPDLL